MQIPTLPPSFMNRRGNCEDGLHASASKDWRARSTSKKKDVPPSPLTYKVRRFVCKGSRTLQVILLDREREVERDAKDGYDGVRQADRDFGILHGAPDLGLGRETKDAKNRVIHHSSVRL